jgi:hypothetical protein
MDGLLDLQSADVTMMHVMKTPWIHLGLELEWLRSEDAVHDQIEPVIGWDKKVQTEAQQVIEAARDQMRRTILESKWKSPKAFLPTRS